MQDIAKTLIIFGVILIIAGVVISLAQKFIFIGRLPGDIHIEKNNFTFYFPIATSILISVVLSFILWIFCRR